MIPQNVPLPVSFTLLMGDDALSREKTRNDAFAALKASEADLAIERFDPENQAFASFTERIITPSLFQTKRFFLIRDAHLLDKNDLELLSDVFAFDIPDVYVVIETDKTQTPKGRGRALSKDFQRWLEHFAKRAEERPEKFSIVECTMPPDYKIAQWLETRTPYLLGRSISRKDAEYLVDLVGVDSSTLHSELQKLDVFLPPQKAIDREAIETISGATRLMTQFELACALGKKDFPKVLEIIDSLYRGSVYIPLYISAIFKHFWALFRIAVFAGTHPEEMRQFTASLKHYNKTVQEKIGLTIGIAAGLLSEKQRSSVYPVIIKPNLAQQALSFTETQYKKIFQWLGEYDIGIKTGRINDAKGGFQILCYKIFRAEEIIE